MIYIYIGLQTLRSSGVRPGFVIIDDGWQVKALIKAILRPYSCSIKALLRLC